MTVLGRLPIRWRLTIAFAVAMAIVLAATGLFLYFRVGSTLDGTIDQGLRTRAAELEGSVQRGDPLDGAPRGLAQVLDENGDVVAAAPGVEQPLVARSDLPAGGSAMLERPFPGGDETARILIRHVDTSRGRRFVVVGTSLEQRGDALETLFTALAIGGPLALLLASLAGYGLAAAALRPVERMRREAESISAATPGRRLSLPAADDEIRRLGGTLNGMLARLELALARQRRFVADASHELRTPLAALRTELELALRRERSREELHAAVRSAADETERLTLLAEDLLLLARAEDGKLPVRRELVDAVEVVETVGRRFERRASEAGRRLTVASEPGLEVSLDRLRAEQALGNLVENALGHGRGSVSLEARRANGAVAFHVRDQGAGFDPAFVRHAFEPFSRPDEARSDGGTGLGLAIVDVIARAHGGTCGVAATDAGADVWIEFPAGASAD